MALEAEATATRMNETIVLLNNILDKRCSLLVYLTEAR